MRLRYVLEVPHRAVVPISVLHDVLHDRADGVSNLLGEGLVIPAAAAACVEIKFQASHAIDAMLLCILYGGSTPSTRGPSSLVDLHTGTGRRRRGRTCCSAPGYTVM